MRQFGILLILGLVLVFIAWQARTGVFRRQNPGEPANKYMRAAMEIPQLSEADAAIIRERYNTAHVNPSGLRYIVRQPGDGPKPGINREVFVHYDGYLLDGTKFESSRGGQPYSFRIGNGKVIKGWEEGIAAMTSGEKRTLIIPWWLGYGVEGHGPIPPKATLVFDVELVGFR